MVILLDNCDTVGVKVNSHLNQLSAKDRILVVDCEINDPVTEDVSVDRLNSANPISSVGININSEGV